MKRLWRTLIFLCSARASTVLQPSPSRLFATTTFKYFGPQTFSLNATGSPLVELRATDLANIHHDGRASTDLTGTIVTFRFADMPNPTNEWLYIALERVGVTAVLVVTTLMSAPGGMYHLHDGAGLMTRRGSMPMLQTTYDDVHDLFEAAQGGETVSLLLEPSANSFIPFWNSLHWVLLIRGLMPLLGFVTGARALVNLRAHVRLGGRSILWPPTNPVIVLVSEMFVTPLLGVIFIGGPHGCSDVWTIATQRFFFSLMTGWSLFTTLIMAVRATRPRGILCVVLSPAASLHWRICVESSDVAATPPLPSPPLALSLSCRLVALAD
jgi:hypothetical protein